MPACKNGAGDIGDAPLRGLGVEVDGILRVREAGFEVGSPSRDAVGTGEQPEFILITPYQNGVRHERRPVRQNDAALIANGDNRANELLVGAHAAGDPVHDDAYLLLFHD